LQSCKDIELRVFPVAEYYADIGNDVVEVIGSKKITPRARQLVGKSLWPSRVQTIDELDYVLFVHNISLQRDYGGVFTIILTAHGGNTSYFNEAFDSVVKQTSSKFELILVDHGCEPELSRQIHQCFLSDERIKLIRFEKNLYDCVESRLLHDGVFNVINAALFCSNGEYSYFLSFDDFISQNYVEAMVATFLGNPNCVVASPSVTSVNEFSKVNTERTGELRKKNKRKTYINGLSLAASVIKGGDNFAAPGGLFAYRTNLVLANGGLDCMNDLSQIFKFAVLGDVGTNYDAVLFWRHHVMQTNKTNAKFGALNYLLQVEWLSHIKDFYLQHCIPISYQNDFFNYMKKRLKEDSFFSIQTSIRAGPTSSLLILRSILREAPNLYMFYFIACFLKNLPYVFYSLLPEKLKHRFRELRRYVIN
jgi:glycosyltransferase involved in cell wall biosynthesis